MEDITQSYTRMGEIALAQGHTEEAIRWCSKSRDIADQGHYWEARVACHECLYEAFRQMEQWELSLQELETYQAIQDSIDQKTNLEEVRLQALRSEYESALSTASKKEAELNQQLSNSTNIKWLLFGCLGTLIIFLLLRFRNKTAETAVADAVQPPESSAPIPLESKEENWLGEFRQQLVKMIESQQTITTGVLASLNHCSERQLLRRIKEETGLTTKQLVQTTRLEVAKRWLEEGRYKRVKDLAEDLGFKSAQYFPGFSTSVTENHQVSF